MKKIVQYLYEYQNGIPIQNVGFIKGECQENRTLLQIYGRGFPTDAGQMFEIFMVYLEDGNCIGISMGTIKSRSPVFGYRLEYDAHDVNGKEIFDRIVGIVISCGQKESRRWYGAAWDSVQMNPEKMIRQEEYEEQLLQTATLDGEEELELGEEPNIPDLEEVEEKAEVQMEPEEESEEEDAAEEEHLEQPIPLEEEWTGEETQAEKDQIFKITREDLARLPRTEWKLANNHFLLHGYHNYHHLVSFEKDGACWIGVPGIYHPQEERVAYSFGFDQFMKPDEGEVELSEEQMEEKFGYWCRKVSSVIGE